MIFDPFPSHNKKKILALETKIPSIFYILWNLVNTTMFNWNPAQSKEIHLFIKGIN